MRVSTRFSARWFGSFSAALLLAALLTVPAIGQIGLDFGDAPDPWAATAGEYPTLSANDGARHVLGSGLFLGATVDAETDGQPNASASGDDNNGDDEDGVTFTSVVAPGGVGSVDVTASAAGLLNAWIDFNNNGSWLDAGEQIFSDQALVAGINNFLFAVPADAVETATFARFRFASAGGLTPVGQAADGEVEDYQVTVTQPGTIIIDKVTAPAGSPEFFPFELYEVEGPLLDSFNLADEDIPYQVQLAPGSYAVFETVPAGWSLTSSFCDNDGSPGSIDLAAGETVTCTFVNTTNVPSNYVGFSKAFEPTTIGPGSVSTLRFTVDNMFGPNPVSLLTFTDTLPAGVTIATPAAPTTSCGGTVVAPDGGTTISFSGGGVAAGGTCLVTVDVTSSTAGVHTNVSGNLTSSDGISGTATADLTVATDRPGFTKSFAPSTVPLGGRSTLTLTIDNSANASALSSLEFTDNFPVGLEIASPANASTDCGGPNPMLTAVAGTSTVSFQSFGILFPGFEVLLAGATCTVTVDVVATGSGLLGNVSSELTSNVGSSGKASDTLEVTVTPLALIKEFTDDPVPPASNVTLEFTVDNFDRNFPATGVAFTDDLTTLVPALPGLTFDSLLANDCGGTVTGVGGTTIGLTGATIAPQGSCTLRVSLSVPAGAVAGIYTNTTSTVTATVDGSPVVGNAAADDLFVVPAPILTKEFLGDPVNPGDTVVLQFTVTNTSPTSSATDVAFQDLFNPILATASVTPGDGCCGAGSTCTFTPLFNPPPPSDVTPATLSISGGTLAPAGQAGDSCTFSITLDVAADATDGIYPNTTTEPTATVDGATRTGEPATDELVVVSAPRLFKAFTDDPVAPGGTVTLEFTLTHSLNAGGDATGITFTDNLTTVLAGLTATGLPLAEACDPDGPGGDPGTGTLSGSAGDTLLTFMGGALSPGESCTFSVTLDVPANAPSGSHTNTTSGVGATVGGVAVTAAPGTDDLKVAGLNFSKEFIDDPVFAGETVTLRFTLENVDPVNDATGITFTDDLSLVLPGTPDLSIVTTLPLAACGGTLSSLSSTFLFFSGGALAQGDPPCTFDITLQVPGPPAVADGDYSNTTGNLTATIGGASVVLDPALDFLTIDSNRLRVTKEFLDDPVVPGGQVIMRLTLSNLDPANAASDVDLTDDLDAALAGLRATAYRPTESTCDDLGFLFVIAGLNNPVLSVINGNLPAGGACTAEFVLDVPAATAPGTYTNTTSVITGTISGFAASGTPASDDLVVVGPIEFSKAFDGATVAGGTPVLTFTLTNTGTTAASDLAFNDDLDAVLIGLVATGLPLTDVCGSGSQIAGTSFLTFSGGSLPPDGGTCSFDVPLQVPAAAAPGTYPNTTSELFRDGLAVADPATADLTVEPPPLFSKAFVPSTIGTGGVSTLTFTIDNTASSLAAASLDFTDNLPTGVVVADPTNQATTCSGGMASAPVGGSTISFAGGTVAAGASCTVSVDVTSAVVGSHVNTTGDLTSSSGNSGTAEATLTVEPPPLFSKAFAPDTVGVGGTSTLTFTIDNSAATIAATGLDFTDNLPAGVVVATPSNASVGCTGGTLTAVSGAAVINYTSGAVAAGAVCTISADVTGTAAGSHVNTSGDLTSSLGNSGTAEATLNVVPVTFDKAFLPATIGPGSTTLLRFDIVNTGATELAENIAFTDNLPAGVVIATPSGAATDCTDGVLSAPDGGTTIALSGARLGASSSCTVSVRVTAAAPGSYENVSGDLTSTLGNSGPATATLTVDFMRPGFSKSFVPATIPPGGTSTLVFTIDYSAFGDGPQQALEVYGADDLRFTDTLPTGLVVATPSNATTDCTGGLFPPLLTADPGTGFILFDSGFVGAGSVCTVEVDVTAAATGLYENVSSELLEGPEPGTTSGFATAALDVPVAFLIKAFVDDPAVPGGTVTLEFTINNPDRDLPATDIAFTDPIDPLGALTGLAPGEALPKAACGGTLDFAAGVLGFSGGVLPAGGSCTFSVLLDVPLAAATGSFVNTTTAITATIDGAGVVGNTASDTLVVNEAPVLTKEFIDDPVGAGGQVTLRFTITNTDPTSTLFDIAFTDDLNTAIIGLAANSLVSGDAADPLLDPCGAGSVLTVFDPPDIVIPPLPPIVTPADPTLLEFSGGSLAPAGSEGDSCTFEVVLDVPDGTPAGTYTNTTSEITALDDGEEPVTGPPASGDLQVIGAPTLTKEFTDDPVAPGDPVTLQFTLSYPAEAPGPATAVTFTDDLAAVVPGLAAAGLPLADVCGPANGTLSGSAGDTLLTLSGVTLNPGDVCAFSVAVIVPAGAASGTFTNTTSNVVATVLGVETIGNPAEDDLAVGGLVLAKEFTDDPVIAGGTVTLEFAITNEGPDPVTNISFDDDLDEALTGLVAVGLPLTDVCGTGSSIGGTGFLSFTGGSLDAGSFCSFSVTLQVPAGTPSGGYVNRTSNFSATIGEATLSFTNASDELVVANEQLLLTKEFTDDPVVPGGTVTLAFSFTTLGISDSAADLAFTDDLEAALSGLTAVGPFNTGSCGGTLSGTGVLTYSGGAFAGGECSFSVTVQVPAAVPFGTTITNTTSIVTGTIEGLPVTGEPASDVLEIDFFDFTKSFDGVTKPTGTPVLTFTILNLSSEASVSDLGFIDDLTAMGIPGLAATALPTEPCGAGSTITGTNVLSLSGGNLLPGGSCTFSVDLLVPASAPAGDFLNVTSELFVAGVAASGAASATLQVEPAPAFSKTFVPDIIFAGQSTKLSFLIDNTGSSFAVSEIDFTDNLPAGVTIAVGTDSGTNCEGGTLTAEEGTGVVSYTGGSLAAGASCLIEVDVEAFLPGSYVNTTGEFTSSSGSSGTATDVLYVLGPGGPCLAANGENVTLQDDTVLDTREVEVCDTITVGPNYVVMGPNGALTLRAGVLVMFVNGAEIWTDGSLVVEIDPSLQN